METIRKQITVEGYTDITDELNTLQRGLLFNNADRLILIGGTDHGKVIGRRFKSHTMMSPDKPDQIYKRTGEILQDDEYGNYYLVFRL